MEPIATVIVTIIGNLTALVIALTALWQSVRGQKTASTNASAAREEIGAVGAAVQKIQIEVNGRITQLLEEATARAHAEGKIAGSEAERAKAPPALVLVPAAVAAVQAAPVIGAVPAVTPVQVETPAPHSDASATAVKWEPAGAA